MTREEMEQTLLNAAVQASGIDTTDPLYLAAYREVKAHTDDELRLLVAATFSGEIYRAAAAVSEGQQ